MKPHRHGRVCTRCGEPSRVGNRVGHLLICRMCWVNLPRKVREWYSEKLKQQREEAA